MVRFAGRCCIFIATIALTGCDYEGVRQQRLAETQKKMDLTLTHARSSVSHIKSNHLAECKTRLEKKIGLMRNKKYGLAGPLRPHTKLLCYFLHADRAPRRNPNATYIYYAAPIKLIEGPKGIHIPTFTPPKSARFLWCRFKVENNVVTLEGSGHSLSGNKYIAMSCGLRTHG